jgi:hypothetical protein
MGVTLATAAQRALRPRQLPRTHKIEVPIDDDLHIKAVAQNEAPAGALLADRDDRVGIGWRSPWDAAGARAGLSPTSST